MKTKKKPSPLSKAKDGDNTKRFAVPVEFHPHGSSVDVQWPDGRNLAVLVHDELMRFEGFAEWWEKYRGDFGGTITLAFFETLPATEKPETRIVEQPIEVAIDDAEDDAE